MSKYQLALLKGGILSDCEINVSSINHATNLDFRSDYFNHNVLHDFPFLGLIEIRHRLNDLNINILCNGARIDVYPSGMTASTLLAYQLRMGTQATEWVNILEPFEDWQLITSVHKQKEFREQWLKSLGNH